MINLTEKKILITGATSGIGFALCERLLEQNNQIIAIGRDINKIENLIEKYSNILKFFQFDLFNIDLIESIFEDLVDGVKFDGFVNCAGMEETMPLPLVSTKNINDIFNINVFSGIELLRLFSKKKYSNDNSSVVFLSSVMGELGQPGKVGYCATKSAVLGVVKASALELSKRKIRVNAISPGVVNTPMTQKLFLQIDDSNKERIIGMHPLGLGEVHDVIPLLEFLLSDGSKWLTGQNIKIDGGYSIQ